MISAILSFAALAAAAPTVKRAGPTDVQILNYALTLEHLENQFYMTGLKNFTRAEFIAAGTSNNFYDNLKEISYDETTHVNFLTKALGSAAVKACTYDFPVTDAASFLAVANVLEGVGISAYLGAAQYIANKAYLTAAGSILTVESRHSAYLRSQDGASPFPAPFDIPLDFDEVYSLASQFIVSCPSTNAKLPVMAFPVLTASPAGVAKVGDVLTLTTAKSVNAVAAYFITATGNVAAPLTGSGMSYSVTVPAGVSAGQDYLVLTTAKAAPSDANIAAGPAVIMIQDNIQALGKSNSGMATGSSSSQSSTTSSGGAVAQSADGQPTTSGAVSQMPDGQPTTSGAVTQMPDGQPISQIADGQIQVQPVSEMGDGQPTASGY